MMIFRHIEFGDSNIAIVNSLYLMLMKRYQPFDPFAPQYVKQ